MSDLSTPLEWDKSPLVATPEPGLAPAPARATDARATDARAADAGAAVPSRKTTREAYRWPMPPYASYPSPVEQTESLPCLIVGRNDRRMAGRMTFFVPEQSVAHVQLPPARTTLGLRFDQFKTLTLTTPVRPLMQPPADPHAGMLGHRASSTYRIEFAHVRPQAADAAEKGGKATSSSADSELTGDTVGHVENELGLFLFPPCDGEGGVVRMFVPKGAIKSFSVGPKIGEVLVEQRSATPQQVKQAVDVQTGLRSQKLGEILVSRQLVSPEHLMAAIERQSKMPMMRIGEALTSLGMVTEAQLHDALEQQQGDRSVALGELLVRMGLVSREDLQVALARKMGYPLVNVDAFPIEPEALRKVPYAVATRLSMMPLLLRDGRLVVALDDPARRRSDVDELEFITQMKIVPVLAQSQQIDAALYGAYEKIGATMPQRPGSNDAAAPIAFELIDTGKLVETLEKEGLERLAADDERPIEQSDNSLVRLLNSMIIDAHNEGVSDIHIESYPGREKIRVRFRKDGLLRTHLELPANYRNALIARVKIMCDLDISERRKPQDGKINFAKFSSQHKIELRVATIPTNSGLEDVVMRILASARPLPVDSLGLTAANLTSLMQAVERPYGMVLCVGPTGSGKTTTLHSALSHINVPERKIWTAEDPIEITQPGLRQVQVNPKIDWTFAKALRAFLRADPDVIMVGEIRDTETASMAVEASLTGHLVLSTLHTNSAPETVTRLLDMGLDPFNFGDSLLAVLAQRLVRRLCTECRTSRPASAEEVDELLTDYLHAYGSGEPPTSRDAVLSGWVEGHGRDGRLMLHRSPGCKACDESGFKGRAGLHEMMVVSREIRRLIQTGARAAELQRVAMAEGMRSLRQDGIVKVLAGATTIEEVRATSNV